MWNVTDPARPTMIGQPLNGHNGPIYAVAFGPDGDTMAAGSGSDDEVQLWKVTDPADATPIGQPLTGLTGLGLRGDVQPG
jgi:WD40 repeat protein